MMQNSPKGRTNEDLIFSKLVELAEGDVSLVNEAIRAVGQKGQAVDLKKIVEYISMRIKRDQRIPA